MSWSNQSWTRWRIVKWTSSHFRKWNQRFGRIPGVDFSEVSVQLWRLDQQALYHRLANRENSLVWNIDIRDWWKRTLTVVSATNFCRCQWDFSNLLKQPDKLPKFWSPVSWKCAERDVVIQDSESVHSFDWLVHYPFWTFWIHIEMPCLQSWIKCNK